MQNWLEILKLFPTADITHLYTNFNVTVVVKIRKLILQKSFLRIYHISDCSMTYKQFPAQQPLRAKQSRESCFIQVLDNSYSLLRMVPDFICEDSISLKAQSLHCPQKQTYDWQ